MLFQEHGRYLVEDTETHIGERDINAVAYRTGPTKPISGEKDELNRVFGYLLKARAGGREIDVEQWRVVAETFWSSEEILAAEFHATAAQTFGYSGRDLDRMMDRAMQIAGKRASDSNSIYKPVTFSATDLPTRGEIAALSPERLVTILKDHGLDVAESVATVKDNFGCTMTLQHEPTQRHRKPAELCRRVFPCYLSLSCAEWNLRF
jgi:hypothetical protein